MAIAWASNFTEFAVVAGNTQSQTKTCTAGSALIAGCYNLTNNADIDADIGGAAFTLDVARNATEGSGGSNIISQLNIAGGSTTVDVNYPGGSANYGAFVMEFTGVATSSAMEASSSNECDTHDNPTASAAGVTTTDADVVVVVYSTDRTTSGMTPKANWTMFNNTGTDAGKGAVAYRIFGGTTSGERGAINFAVGSHYAACIAAYKPAAGGGGGGGSTGFHGTPAYHMHRGFGYGA